jgi:hypothetical protein
MELLVATTKRDLCVRVEAEIAHRSVGLNQRTKAIRGQVEACHSGAVGCAPARASNQRRGHRNQRAVVERIASYALDMRR